MRKEKGPDLKQDRGLFYGVSLRFVQVMQQARKWLLTSWR